MLKHRFAFVVAAGIMAASVPAFAKGGAPAGDSGSGSEPNGASPSVESGADRINRAGVARPLENHGIAPVPLTGRDALMAARR